MARSGQAEFSLGLAKKVRDEKNCKIERMKGKRRWWWQRELQGLPRSTWMQLYMKLSSSLLNLQVIGAKYQPQGAEPGVCTSQTEVSVPIPLTISVS